MKKNNVIQQKSYAFAVQIVKGYQYLCEDKMEFTLSKQLLRSGTSLGVNIDFTKYITGSTIPHIYFKDYKNEEIHLPSLPEQEKIANFLSAIDEKINHNHTQPEKPPRKAAPKDEKKYKKKMNQYNPHKHHRRSIRLKGYDYAQAGLYFITICVQNRECLFGTVENGEMILNEYGQIAYNEWQKTPEIRTNVALGEFIIMPNHIHGIVEIIFQKENSKSEIGKFQSPSQTIGSIIRGYKIATIKKIKDLISLNSGGELKSEINRGESKTGINRGELKFAPTEKIIQLDFKIWQRNYYEHIIRNEQAYQNISNYIVNNPLNWNKDKFHG
ncbi:MAG: four helix bundle protein [Bacteroidia bacterium]|nr:four helix bundle protein [Bacteroidia bacterium]